MPPAEDSRLWFASALLPEGWASNVRISMQAGRIASVEPRVPAAPDDERHAIGLPGLANLHSHAFQRGMAGLTEIRGASGNSFWTWRELMYRFADALTPEDLEALTAYAYVEMLESGFTRVGEFHYLHHAADGTTYADRAELSGRIAAAAADAGIALTLLPVFYAHSGFGGTAPKSEQRRFVNDLDGYARLLDAARQIVASVADGRVGVAAHSLRAVTPQELLALMPLVADGPVHIHIAEQLREVEECLAWCGRRPVEWLLDHAEIDAKWCLVHATHLTEAELQGLAASRAVAGPCPITEANLGDGVFPADAFLRAGGRIGIGTDSNVLIDAAQELRLLEYTQRLTHHRRNVLAGVAGHSTGRHLFDAARAGGAQALGVATPELQVGAAGDVFSLDSAHVSLLERRGDAMLDSWIFAGEARMVDCVWRRGRKLVEHGEHHARAPIAARYERTLKKLLG